MFASAARNRTSRSAVALGQVLVFFVATAAAVQLTGRSVASSAGTSGVDAPARDLVVEDVEVTRRTTAAGGDVLIIAGHVRSRSGHAATAIPVEVQVGATRLQGVTGRRPDPFAVERIARPDDIFRAAETRAPEEPTSPPDPTRFVLIGPVPPDGTIVHVVARADGGTP